MHHTNSFRYTSPFRYTLYSTVFAAAVMITGPAGAHWGHLGDLAGHAHLAGAVLAGEAGVLAAGLIATRGNGDNADEREYETGDGEGSADGAADISGGPADIDSPADPVPASNMTIAGPIGHLPANKSFLEGVWAHG